MLAKNRAHRATNERITIALRAVGITPGEWLALGVIADTPSPSAQTLAGELGVGKAMSTKLTNALLLRVLIEECRSPHDARQNIYTITKEGRDVLVRADTLCKESLKAWLSGIDPTDVQTYIEVLNKVPLQP